MEYLNNLQAWHWLAAALVLVGLELVAPGAVFIWLAAAAALVGLIMLVIPLAWEIQFVLAAVFSFLSLAAWFRFRHRTPTDTSHPTLNRRGASIVGRTFTLRDPIVDGEGKIIVDDSTWKVRGPDLGAGTRVKVADIDGTILIVEVAA